MTDEPDHVEGASDAANELQQRADAAKMLMHVLTGDSWGVQDVLLHDPTGARAVFTHPLWWQAGHLLRTYLTDDERNRLLDRIQRELYTDDDTYRGDENGY